MCVCGWEVLLNESLAIKVISNDYFDYHLTSLKSILVIIGCKVLSDTLVGNRLHIVSIL